MLVRYWQPFAEINTLRRQFDRMFDDLAGLTDGDSQLDWTPPIELQDTGAALVLRAQLPGIAAKDLDIQVTKEAVAISGEHRQEQRPEESNLFRSEFRYGKFQRVIPLPVAVQHEQVQAEYKDGILHLTLPKLVEAQNKVIKINLAELNSFKANEALEESRENATKASHN
jgi:HSP20 family protein